MKYKRPHALNWVSFAMLLVAGLIAYALVYLWPVYRAQSRVKGILWDHIPALYKANLLSPEVTRPLLEDIKTSIRTEFHKAGINEKTVKIFLRHNPKEIELEARFKVKARFLWVNKTYEFDMSPKVVSDATRVDW